MVTQREIGQWLHEGITAAKAGEYDRARFRLLDVVEQDQTNEAAWFWLYQAFEYEDDKRICLENLLIINPQNRWARQELLKYLQPEDRLPPAPRVGQPPPASPALSAPGRDQVPTGDQPGLSYLILIRLIAAFWLGISLILLGGGIMAIGEWLATGFRTAVFADYLTAFRFFELFVSTLFVILGVFGINVAIGLFLRSMAGFYGSFLLALGLLLVGPTVSLIITPPNYLAMFCTGGIAGTIVLLTLASQPGFE